MADHPNKLLAQECWEWNGYKNNMGYGLKSRKNRRKLVHRLAWEWVNGPIPSGMNILHRCDNPPCVNPNHLFMGTQADNMMDKKLKGRGRKLICKRGHAMEPSNLRISMDSRGHEKRECLLCERIRRPSNDRRAKADA